MTSSDGNSSTISNAPIKRKRWTQNTAWYLFLPRMEQAVKYKIISKIITRDYSRSYLMTSVKLLA
jgi:hypothetical protein